jgi:hypothetical protein
MGIIFVIFKLYNLKIQILIYNNYDYELRWSISGQDLDENL